MKQKARTLVLTIALAMVSVTAFGGAVTNTNLTQLTAPGVLRDSWVPTTDNERVVFVAQGDTAEEIYSVRLDQPGEIVQLSSNGQISGAAEVIGFEVSEDGQHVVYLVYLPGVTVNSERLLSVPVDGSGSPTIITTVELGTLDVGGIDFEVSPASDRVVYLETTETEYPLTESALFSQLITGGGTSALHPAELGISFEVSRSGAYVAYSVLSLTENAKIYGVPTAGGSGVQLNDDSDLPGSFAVGPNSQRVVFTAVAQEGSANTLQSAPISGGGQTLLATAAENAAIGIFQVNNDKASPRVVFVESTDAGQSRLVSVLITGGDVENLTNGLIDGGISPIRFSPNGQHVVFQVIQPQSEDDFTAELFSAPVQGIGAGAPSTFFKGSADNAAFTFVPSFGSTRLLYGAVDADDQAGDLPGTRELLSADIGGGAAETLVGPLPGNLRVFFFFPFFPEVEVIFKNGFEAEVVISEAETVLYLADQEQDDVFELYTVPISGGENMKRNNPLPAGGDVTSAFPTPDSSKLIYNADQETDGLFDLYLVPVGQEPEQEQIQVRQVMGSR